MALWLHPRAPHHVPRPSFHVPRNVPKFAKLPPLARAFPRVLCFLLDVLSLPPPKVPMFPTLLLSVLLFSLTCLAASIVQQSLALAVIGALSLIVGVLFAALVSERGE